MIFWDGWFHDRLHVAFPVWIICRQGEIQSTNSWCICHYQKSFIRWKIQIKTFMRKIQKNQIFYQMKMKYLLSAIKECITFGPIRCPFIDTHQLHSWESNFFTQTRDDWRSKYNCLLLEFRLVPQQCFVMTLEINTCMRSLCLLGQGRVQVSTYTYILLAKGALIMLIAIFLQWSLYKGWNSLIHVMGKMLICFRKSPPKSNDSVRHKVNLSQYFCAIRNLL